MSTVASRSERRPPRALAARGLRALRAIRHEPPTLLFGLVLLSLFLILAIAPGLFAPHDPNAIGGIPLSGSSSTNLLGTDEDGRDILSRVIYSARVDLPISIAAGVLAAVGGAALGLVSGYVGGLLDTVTMRAVDIGLAFPTVVLALFLIVILGRSEGTEILAIALVMMPSMARFSRGAALALRPRAFVEASRTSGAPVRHIVWRHILPNALSPLLVAASVLASAAVLLSASLSYLGLGVQPPTPTWGGMLSEAFDVVYQAPVYGVVPGICVVLLSGAYLLIGTGLRTRQARGPARISDAILEHEPVLIGAAPSAAGEAR
jgi:peptide/nickel transport system permease protein